MVSWNMHPWWLSIHAPVMVVDFLYKDLYDGWILIILPCNQSLYLLFLVCIQTETTKSYWTVAESSYNFRNTKYHVPTDDHQKKWKIDRASLSEVEDGI